MSFAENGALSPADVAAVTGNGNMGWGGDSAWWLIILFLFMFNGNWGNGFAGNGGGVGAEVQRGFDQSAVMSGLQGVQNAVTTGFGDTALGLANLGQNVMAQGYQGQIAMMQGFNGMQSQFANCCCENRLGIANLGADIAREACADRQAISEGLMNLTAQNNANTNILVNTMNAGFQGLKDQMFQQQLETEKRENDRLRMENYIATLRESQTGQTGQINANTDAQIAAAVARILGNGCGCGVA